MENSSNSNSTKLDFGLDSDIISPFKWRKKLVKYNTMGDREEIQEIELSSEFSQFEESDNGGSEDDQSHWAFGKNSEGGFVRQKSFPKLMKTKIERQISSEFLK